MKLNIWSKSSGGIVFVTDVRGPVGRRVVLRLLKSGYTQVRVGFLSAADDTSFQVELQEMGAEAVVFDWDKETTYSHALMGVDTVFCICPHSSANWASHFPAFHTASRMAGVSHFVKLSFYHALTSTRAHIMQGFHVALPGKYQELG